MVESGRIRWSGRVRRLQHVAPEYKGIAVARNRGIAPAEYLDGTRAGRNRLERVALEACPDLASTKSDR
jgi:hypothetical protein